MTVTVYLAGGFRSGWDDQAASEMPSLRCIQPKLSGLKEIDEFTPWDLDRIDESDVILCYVEKDNPGLNWMFELGYALKSSKYIVLVVDPLYYITQDVPQRYVGMALASADMLFAHLSDAILHVNDWAARVAVPLPDKDGSHFVKQARESGPQFQLLEAPKPEPMQEIKKTVEGWIVDFVGPGAVPEDFNPDAVTQGTDETGLPDYIWGRALNSFRTALRIASSIAEEEGVYFDHGTLGTLVKQAKSLDDAPEQEEGWRYVCVRRVGV